MRFGMEPFVRSLESSYGVLHVIGALFEGLGIPFAARRGKKISAINVDRRGNLIERIRNSMNNRCAQRSGILRVQLLGPVLLQAVLGAAVKRILLTTSIDADDGPHAMIVGVELHPRCPAQGEGSPIVWPVNRLDA